MPAAAEFRAELAAIRRSYVEATPKQRLSIAKQRIRYPEHGPNVLVANVSAVEGFARCLAMHCHAKTKAELSVLYPKYRFKSAEELIGEYLSARGLGEPRAFFGGDAWELFQVAVEFRNLLAHECTYLGQDKSPALVDACQSVLSALAESHGLPREVA
jgi:hypothetical protein